jgi:hypothetical protein
MFDVLPVSDHVVAPSQFRYQYAAPSSCGVSTADADLRGS